MKKQKYNLLLRILHWTMALIIITLLVIGLYMTGLSKDDPTRLDLYNLHKSLGVTVILLAVFRVAIRLVTKIPPLPAGLSAFVKKSAHAAHYALYFFMFALPISGYLLSNSYGYVVELFGYPLPKIFPENKDTGGLAAESHEILAYILIGVLILHVLGVIKHRFFDGKENDVLGRML